jgi:ABC-type bacteriocin/lantibiotic exporter with double-glycine peptidase domain
VLRLAGCWRARDDHQRRCDGGEHLRRRCEETAWPRAGTLELPDRGEWLLSVRHLTTAAGGVRNPLSFDLLAGRWLGITGRSGCGKSTLLRVLAGVETPAHGEVVFNGVPILQLAPAARGRLVRLLPQAPVMFSASIAENIGLGDPAAGPEAILTAARVCGVGELAEQLPRHLNTIVGPAGRQLSGGEQQRVALARAVLSRPRLLLLDEATAGLDEAGEARLLADLRRFLPETAVVLVSHRASTLAGCPQVLDLVAPAGGPVLNVVAD